MKLFKIATLLFSARLLLGWGRAGYCENRAVVFGCNGPSSGGVNLLHYAESDAQKMADQLKHTNGLFDEGSVRLYTGESSDSNLLPTRENLKKALKWLGEAGPKSTVLFYFSGHGAQGSQDTNASEIEKSARLVTSDYTSTNSQSGYPVVELHQSMNGMNVFNGITLLDSCFSGIEIPVARNSQAKLRLAADDQPQITAKDTSRFQSIPGASILTPPAPVVGRNRILLTSCQSFERSFETDHLPDSSGGGVFTYFLCKGLSVMPTIITAMEV